MASPYPLSLLFVVAVGACKHASKLISVAFLYAAVITPQLGALLVHLDQLDTRGSNDFL